MGCNASKDAEEQEKLHSFARHCRLVAFTAGSKIFEQNEHGEEFFIVGAGECSISCLEEGTTDKSEKQVFLCLKKKGDFFGERAILEESGIRSATVVATEDCLLLSLSRQNFKKFLGSLDADSQFRVCSIMGTKMLDSLKEIDFLQGLDDFRLGLLANVFRYVTVQAGETIFNEGDLGRDLYIISDGTVSVSAKSGSGAAHATSVIESAGNGSDENHHKKEGVNGSIPISGASRASFIAAPIPIEGEEDADEDGNVVQTVVPAKEAKDVQFATLKNGQYFGEVSLMVDLPRTATVRALTRCLLLVLNTVDFDNFVSVVPGLRQRLEKLASARIAQQFRKFNVPFFQTIPETRFKALSDLCELKRFEKDEVIFHEGDIPAPNTPAFYLVVSGRLVARKTGIGIVGTLMPPSYFGEIALVTDSPRQATIITDTSCVLLSLTKESFQQFFIQDAENEANNAAANASSAAANGEVISAGQQYAEFSIKLSQKQVPLKPVLNHSLGHKLFSQHLANEYSTENISFYDKAGIFETLDPQKDQGQAAQMLIMSEEIVDEFIRADAATQVNIPSATRENCLKEFREGRITTHMFTAARLEIFKLMAADSFKRFKSSPLFQKLLDTVGSYENKSTPALQNHRLSTVAPTPSAAASSSSSSSIATTVNSDGSIPVEDNSNNNSSITTARPSLINVSTSPSPRETAATAPALSPSGAQQRKSVNIHAANGAIVTTI